MVAATAADCKARTAMQHAVIRAKRFIKSPSRLGLTFDSRRSCQRAGHIRVWRKPQSIWDWGIENDLFNPLSWETLLGRPAHEARIKLLHRAHAALLHGYARLVAYDLEHALDAFLAEGSQPP